LSDHRVTIIGAGVAGLVAAVDLASRGMAVTVAERRGQPGGKMREAPLDGSGIDMGPTVLTMARVFHEVFADAGSSLEKSVRLQPLETLARHAWSESERLDLHADMERSVDAIGAFAGAAEARRYRAFCERARNVYNTLEHAFIRAERPSPVTLTRSVGAGRLGDLFRISPFSSLWRALGQHFQDPRLRQLFGRYATYVGSSPFAAPATLMLIAHVESEGVWTVEGGMQRLPEALAGLAAGLGVRLRYNDGVERIQIAGGRATGVVLESGERIDADAVVCNADVAALASGLFGDGARQAAAPVNSASRSLSALTWAMPACTSGFPLLRHTVFFCRDYAAEFEDIFRRGRTPRDPTVYICAQDRGGGDEPAHSARERLFCLVNAPANGDIGQLNREELDQCERRMTETLDRCGLRLDWQTETCRITTPTEFEALFPATGGALYGRASHGWNASFQRPGSRSRVPGLYLAGGSVHPGAGVPMAAISGRLAAASVVTDLTSSTRSRRQATPGGT